MQLRVDGILPARGSSEHIRARSSAARPTSEPWPSVNCSSSTICCGHAASHDVKIGVQTSWTRSHGDFRNLRDGRYQFERDLPFSPSDPLSFPLQFVMIDGPTAWDVSAWSAGAFAQDNWR